MIKKFAAVLASLIFSFSSCKAIQMEVVDGNFTYIVDTSKNTAIVRDIYIPLGKKEDIKIPSTVTDGCKQKYTINEISEYAIKPKATQIASIELPNTLDYTDRNVAMLKYLFSMKIPVKRTIVSVIDFFGINSTFKAAFFPGVI